MSLELDDISLINEQCYLARQLFTNLLVLISQSNNANNKKSKWWPENTVHVE